MDGDSTCCIREAGWNRAQKLLRSGELKRLWLASDAETHFAEQVCAEAAKAGVLPDRSKTGRELMEFAGTHGVRRCARFHRRRFGISAERRTNRAKTGSKKWGNPLTNAERFCIIR